MQLRFGTQVLQVKVAVGMGLHRYNLETSHDSGLSNRQSDGILAKCFNTYSRIGAMRTNRDEADIPVTLAARLVVGLDDRQASILSGSTRVRLKRACSKSGNLAKVGLEFLERDVGSSFNNERL